MGHELLKTAHAANYMRSMAQESLTAAQMHEVLSKIISDGFGNRKVFMMEVDGLAYAIPVKMIFAAEEYDGEIIWII